MFADVDCRGFLLSVSLGSALQLKCGSHYGWLRFHFRVVLMAVAHRCWFSLSFKACYCWLDMLQMSRCSSCVCVYCGWMWLWSLHVLTRGNVLPLAWCLTGQQVLISAAFCFLCINQIWLLLLGLMCCTVVKCSNGVILVLITVAERSTGFYCGFVWLTDCQDQSGPHGAWLKTDSV